MQSSIVTKLINRNIVLSPLLTGILFLIYEQRINFLFYTFREIFLLNLIVLAFCIVSQIIFNLLIKNKIKASLVATVFIIINLFYLDIVNFFHGIGFLNLFVNKIVPLNHDEIFYIPFLFILWILFWVFMVKYKRMFRAFNLYINFILLLFILSEVIKWVLIINPQVKLVDNTSFSSRTTDGRTAAPSIYYIILDSYTSPESLRKYWGYDDSLFVNSLSGKGFYVTQRSKTYYNSTPLCIASYLNSSYLNLNNAKSLEHNLYSLIKNNKLLKFLSERGYSIFNYSLFDIGNKNKYYDFLTYNHFLGRTLWYVNYMKLKHLFFPSTTMPKINLRIFNYLQDPHMIESGKPVFVYAHIMMPHIPFYFDENGNKIDNNKFSDKEKYLKQLIYTNKLTLQTVDKLLNNQNPKPIIIIQGDHGYRMLKDVGESDHKKESFSVFNAYYFSDRDYTALNDSISPVNTFRVVLDKYFGCCLPLLKDTIIDNSKYSNSSVE